MEKRVRERGISKREREINERNGNKQKDKNQM